MPFPTASPSQLRSALIRLANSLADTLEQHPPVLSALRDTLLALVGAPEAQADANTISLTPARANTAPEHAPSAPGHKPSSPVSPGSTTQPPPAEQAPAKIPPAAPLTPPASREAITGLAQHFTGAEASFRQSNFTSHTVAPANTQDDPLSVWKDLGIRCDLMVEAAEYAAERESNPDGHDPATYGDLIGRAKLLQNMFLWPCEAHRAGSHYAEEWRQLAECFRNLSTAVGIMQQSLAVDEAYLQRDAAELTAEAQSAVRAAVKFCGLVDEQWDGTQVMVYSKLMEVCRREQIFLRRHMRITDLADPTQAADLATRLESFTDQREKMQHAVRDRKKYLGKIRYEAGQMQKPGAQLADHWPKILDAVQTLLDGGMPPTSKDFRTLLIPLIESRDDVLPIPENHASEKVFEELDHFLASQEVANATNGAPETANNFSPEVEKVRKWLQGSTLVLVGGDERQEPKRRIMKAFGLKDLNWVATRSHNPEGIFPPAVNDPDVKVVILAIRWASHAYGPTLNELCVAAGKSLIRLPAGYHPNQLATQILAQCGDSLEGEDEPEASSGAEAGAN